MAAAVSFGDSVDRQERAQGEENPIDSSPLHRICVVAVQSAREEYRIATPWKSFLCFQPHSPRGWSWRLWVYGGTTVSVGDSHRR
jgi:hypothetical protein